MTTARHGRLMTRRDLLYVVLVADAGAALFWTVRAATERGLHAYLPLLLGLISWATVGYGVAVLSAIGWKDSPPETETGVRRIG